MKGIKGQLSSLSITDLMQWIDMNKKSGVLFVSLEDEGKCFCFEEGRLLMASSNRPGGRFGEFLSREGGVPLGHIRDAVAASRREGMPLLGYLIEKKIVPAAFLKVAVEQLAEAGIMDILRWEDGSFQFVEDLPRVLAKGPVRLGVNFITFEAVRKHDELLKEKGR